MTPIFKKNSKILQSLNEAKINKKKPGQPWQSLLTLTYIFTLTAIFHHILSQISKLFLVFVENPPLWN